MLFNMFCKCLKNKQLPSLVCIFTVFKLCIQLYFLHIKEWCFSEVVFARLCGKTKEQIVDQWQKNKVILKSPYFLIKRLRFGHFLKASVQGKLIVHFLQSITSKKIKSHLYTKVIYINTSYLVKAFLKIYQGVSYTFIIVL